MGFFWSFVHNLYTQKWLIEGENEIKSPDCGLLDMPYEAYLQSGLKGCPVFMVVDYIKFWFWQKK